MTQATIEKNGTDIADSNGHDQDNVSPKSGFTAFLSSPFVVTFLGGAFATLITLAWQQRAADIGEKKAVAAQHYVDQQKLMADFADGFPAAMERLYDCTLQRTRDVYFFRDAQVKGAAKEASDKWVKADNLYVAARQTYLSNPSPETYCLKARIIFDTSAVNESAQSLDEVLVNLGYFQQGVNWQADKKAMDSFHDQANVLYEKMLSAMGKELTDYRAKSEN